MRSADDGGVERAGGWPAVLRRLLAGASLGRDEARAAMSSILAGDATPSQLTAFMVALRAKGEAAEELAGMLDAVRDAAVAVALPDAVAASAIDIVGTGGDGSHSVNISTMAALVLAGGDVPVCKHGNRAASSSCGAADVLEHLGVVIDLGPEGVARCVVEAGIGFCFAPRFHPAFRHAGPSRREIGIPTSFNLLGPLANPAAVPYMVVGVGDPTYAARMADALAASSVHRAWVVHGAGGLDELSTAGVNEVLAVEAGSVTSLQVDPASLGLRTAGPEALKGGDAAVNAGVLRRVLAGEPGAVREVVLFNAAAGFVVAGRAQALDEGLQLARASIDTGAARRALDRLVATSAQARAAEVEV